MINTIATILECISGKTKSLKPFLIFIGLLVFILIIIFPFIDSNFLYFHRAEKRIAILQKIIDLDMTKIEEDVILNAEYNSILRDISQQESRYLNTVSNKIIEFTQKEDLKKESLLKGIFAALIPFVLFITSLFFAQEER